MNQDAEYLFMNESDFAEDILNSVKPVLVEFGADWSGGCRVMEPIVADLVSRHLNVRHVKLDISRNRHLVLKYGIRDSPTFLFIKNGEIVDSITGSVPKKQFEEKISLIIT